MRRERETSFNIGRNLDQRLSLRGTRRCIKEGGVVVDLELLGGRGKASSADAAGAMIDRINRLMTHKSLGLHRMVSLWPWVVTPSMLLLQRSDGGSIGQPPGVNCFDLEIEARSVSGERHRKFIRKANVASLPPFAAVE